MRWGLFFFLIIILPIIAFATWIAFTQYRARQAGLPPPSWKSYIPFSSSRSVYQDSSYPTPRSGGVMGWVQDRLATFRNKRTAVGAYEGPSSDAAYHSRLAADPDDVWNARMGAGIEPDGFAGATGAPGGGGGGASGAYHGYYEEQELGVAPRGSQDSYEGGPDAERGRSRNRESSPYVTQGFEERRRDEGQRSHAKQPENPFGDNAEPSRLRDISPRPARDDDASEHRMGTASPDSKLRKGDHS